MDTQRVLLVHTVQPTLLLQKASSAFPCLPPSLSTVDNLFSSRNTLPYLYQHILIRI
jgi:hypothetical protein